MRLAQLCNDSYGNGSCPNKRDLVGTPNMEPQEYSSNILEYKDPARYIPIIFLLYSWVPNKVPCQDLGFRVWR